MTDEEVEKYFEDKCGTYFEATKAEIKEDVCNAFEDGYNKGKAEAKEIIKGLLESCFGYNSKTVDYEIKAKAEKFLEESKE